MMTSIARQAATVLLLVPMMGIAVIADEGKPDSGWQAEAQALRVRMAEQDAKIAAQEIELAKLRQEVGTDWTTRADAGQIACEVIADADTQATFPAAGWDKGFFLQSPDGNYRLGLLGQIQGRYMFSTSPNAYDGATSTDFDDDRGGFEMSRIRLGFKGHVVDPSWQYFIWSGYSGTGSALLLDAYIRKDLGDGWALTAGQFKTPLLQEWLVSETRQQFVERSLVNGLSGSYSQGLMLSHRDDQLNVMASVNDGLVGINSAWNTEDVESVGVTGRAEWLVCGDWAQYPDFESWPGEQPMWVLGSGIHYQQGEYGTSGAKLSTGDEAQTIRWTVDSAVEFGGANVFAAFVANHLRDADMVSDIDTYGVVVQGGVFLTDDIETIARYEWGDYGVAGIDPLSIVTVGVNKFFAKHAVKWTTDVAYAFHSLNTMADGAGNMYGWPSSAAGWQPDADSADGQVVARTQVQLLF